MFLKISEHVALFKSAPLYFFFIVYLFQDDACLSMKGSYSSSCPYTTVREHTNSLQFCRLWEHESPFHCWPDLLCVLRTDRYPAQHGGAQQGGQVHARYREEHLRLPRGEDRAKSEQIFNHLDVSDYSGKFCLRTLQV